MQVSSDESAAMMYFVATPPFLGDKRTAYGRHIRFALSTLNINGAPADDVTTDSPGDDVIIRGFHVDFSLVARLLYSPLGSTTYYTVINLSFWIFPGTTIRKGEYISYKLEYKYNN